MITLIERDDIHVYPNQADAQEYLARLAYELACEGWRDLELTEGALYAGGVMVAEWYDDSPDQGVHTGVYDVESGEEVIE
jgi:hypothetical protein